jgi:regulator of cell morphogenesis and NO signaling
MIGRLEQARGTRKGQDFMEILPKTLVGSIVSEMEDAIPYFERLRIDYACGGDTPLGEACERAGIPVEEAIQTLEEMAGESVQTSDWDRRSMAEIIHYLVHYHHAYTRVQIEHLNGLLEEVCLELGFKNPQILILKELFKEMGPEMKSHMSKEEDLVFPYLIQMEEAEGEHRTLPNASLSELFLSQPLRILHWEHQMTGAEWDQVRLLTDDYAVRDGTSPKLAKLLSELRELELDIHRHVSLENNVLYHRAVEKGWLE